MLDLFENMKQSLHTPKPFKSYKLHVFQIRTHTYIHILRFCSVMNSFLFLKQALSALICCGHIFYAPFLSDYGILYVWLDMLLTSKDEKVSEVFLHVRIF